MHLRRSRWILTAPLVLLLAGCAGAAGELERAQAPAQQAVDARLAQVDRLMAAYSGEVPGASVVVMKDGEVLLSRGYGLADVENRVPAGSSTNYRLASVTKQFTAAAVLLLVQEGKLGLDDPLRKWLPGMPKVADAMTVRNLVNHTSGLLDYEDLMPKPYPGQISDAGVLALLEKEDRTYFPPGSQYRYSNSAYALLALIVERASGQDFPGFVRTRLFEPAGLQGTLAYVAGGPAIPDRAYGHSQVEGAWTRTDQNAYSAVLGDGGIYSNVDDLARWSRFIDGDGLFDARSRELMFSHLVQVSSEPEPVFYGFGWRVSAQRQWHAGESIGFRNALVRWPAQRLTVAVLTNRNEPTPVDLALQIGGLFLDAPGKAAH